MTENKIDHLIIFLLLFCSWVPSYGQTQSRDAGQSPADKFRQDFTFFRKNIQDKYPSLYLYTDQQKMNAVIDSCYTSINEKTTDLEFYKMFKVLLGEVKDGHLYCSLPVELEKYRNEKALFFPVKLRFIDNKVWVDRTSNPQIPTGAEILSINNQPIDAITAALSKYIVSDGKIQTKKLQILNNFFYFYYFLAYGEMPSFDVTYKLKDGQIKNSKIFAELEKPVLKHENTEIAQPLLNFSIRPDQIGLMTIKSFDPAELKTDFSAFLKTTFQKINDLHIKKLIIDLRGNGGGKDTYGSLLYAYLANKPFRYYKRLQTATKALEFDKFKSKVSSYNNLSPKMIKKVHDHQYELREESHPNLQLINPHQYYNGEVWFLIDGSCFSTTAEFCAIAYSNNRGQFIGDETGGTYLGNTSGVQSEIILPNTKMEISFGTVRYEMDVNKPKEMGRGIIPQHKVQSSIQDIISKHDLPLHLAIAFATKHNN